MGNLHEKDSVAKGTRDWPHAPPHRLGQAGVYFLTARTADQRHLFSDDSMKDWSEQTPFTLAFENHWKLEAWAVLSNHYHIIAHVPEGPDENKRAAYLRKVLTMLHSLTTKELSRRENKVGRTRLWQNFREKHLVTQKSYLASTTHTATPSTTGWWRKRPIGNVAARADSS